MQSVQTHLRITVMIYSIVQCAKQLLKHKVTYCQKVIKFAWKCTDLSGQHVHVFLNSFTAAFTSTSSDLLKFVWIFSVQFLKSP